MGWTKSVSNQLTLSFSRVRLDQSRRRTATDDAEAKAMEGRWKAPGDGRRWRRRTMGGGRRATGDDGDGRRGSGSGSKGDDGDDGRRATGNDVNGDRRRRQGRRRARDAMVELNLMWMVDGRLFAPREKNVGIQYSHRVAHGRGRRRVRISNFKFQN